MTDTVHRFKQTRPDFSKWAATTILSKEQRQLGMAPSPIRLEVRVMNIHGACSTLSLANLSLLNPRHLTTNFAPYTPHHVMLSTLAYYPDWHRLSGFFFSALYIQQAKQLEFLKSLGAVCSEPVHNTKNGTDVVLGTLNMVVCVRNLVTAIEELKLEPVEQQTNPALLRPMHF